MPPKFRRLQIAMFATLPDWQTPPRSPLGWESVSETRHTRHVHACMHACMQSKDTTHRLHVSDQLSACDERLQACLFVVQVTSCDPILDISAPILLHVSLRVWFSLTRRSIFQWHFSHPQLHLGSPSWTCCACCVPMLCNILVPHGAPFVQKKI